MCITSWFPDDRLASGPLLEPRFWIPRRRAAKATWLGHDEGEIRRDSACGPVVSGAFSHDQFIIVIRQFSLMSAVQSNFWKVMGSSQIVVEVLGVMVIQEGFHRPRVSHSPRSPAAESPGSSFLPFPQVRRVGQPISLASP